MYSHIKDSTMERYSPDSKNRHQTMYSHIQDQYNGKKGPGDSMS